MGRYGNTFCVFKIRAKMLNLNTPVLILLDTTPIYKIEHLSMLELCLKIFKCIIKTMLVSKVKCHKPLNNNINKMLLINKYLMRYFLTSNEIDGNHSHI